MSYSLYSLLGFAQLWLAAAALLWTVLLIVRAIARRRRGALRARAAVSPEAGQDRAMPHRAGHHIEGNAVVAWTERLSREMTRAMNLRATVAQNQTGHKA